MFKTAAAFAALTLAAAPALAADHEGFRFGLDYLQTDAAVDAKNNFFDADLDGDAAFGAHVGYDVQLGDVVVGAAVTYADTESSKTRNDFGVVSGVSLDSLATVEGRVGYAFGDFMPYALGGVVRRDVTFTECTSVPPVPPNPVPTCAALASAGNDDTAALWGAGVEWNVDEHFAVNVAYAKADFETASAKLAAAPAFDYDQDVEFVRVSGSFRF